MRTRVLSSLLLASLLPALGCAGAPEPCAATAAGCVEGAVTDDDAGSVEDDVGPPAIVPVGANEHDIGYGWIGAGQPTEERLTEVVDAGARVLSLRYPDEDPFDEQALVEGLGGTFLRYPTRGESYQDVAFREGMYDLYDAQMAEGGPVYLHCASSNRVGASWALYHAERKGVPPEEAIQIGRDAGLSSLEPMVRGILGLE